MRDQLCSPFILKDKGHRFLMQFYVFRINRGIEFEREFLSENEFFKSEFPSEGNRDFFSAAKIFDSCGKEFNQLIIRNLGTDRDCKVTIGRESISLKFNVSQLCFTQKKVKIEILQSTSE